MKSCNPGDDIDKSIKALSRTDPCSKNSNVRYQTFENIYDQAINGCVHSYPKLNNENNLNDCSMKSPFDCGEYLFFQSLF